MPPITVIIPTFNRAQQCLAALKSIYAQTSLPAQVIVVDDGSTESMNEVKKCLELHQGLYIFQQNSGVSSARNLGASKANQDWLAFLDSDDLWLSEKLEKQFQLHLNDPDLFISQTAEIWKRNGKLVNQKNHHAPACGECFERCVEICCISASAVMIRRDIFYKHDGFDTDFQVCEDYEFWLRLSREYKVGLVREALVVKNRGTSEQLSESVQALDRYRLKALLKQFSTKLSHNQRQLIYETAINKLNILEKGAIKRKLVEDLKQYQEIRMKIYSDMQGKGSIANL